MFAAMTERMFAYRPDVAVDETAARSANFRANSTARGRGLWRRCGTISPQAVEKLAAGLRSTNTPFGECSPRAGWGSVLACRLFEIHLFLRIASAR